MRLIAPSGISLLLADADQNLAEVSAKFLGTHGVRVKIVADRTLVSRELERTRYDALVLATNLDSALDLCKQSRSGHSALPIVVIGTGVANERVLVRLAGADDYLRRPYSSRDLVERIVVITRRRRSAFPLISSR